MGAFSNSQVNVVYHLDKTPTGTRLNEPFHLRKIIVIDKRVKYSIYRLRLDY